MSADFTAIAMIGVRIPYKKTLRRTTARGCKHNTPEAKFCSECGQSYWHTEEYNIFQDIPYAGSYRENEIFRKAISTDKEYIIVGPVATKASCYEDDGTRQHRYLDNIEVYKQQCKNLLEPLGLWGDDKFGLWSILHCGY